MSASFHEYGGLPDLRPSRVGRVAAAAQESQGEWKEFTGEWITEIAFSDIPDEDASQILSHIRILVRIEPSLGSTLGRAQAALQAYLAR